MKTVLTLLFLLVIYGTSIAQSNENYRSRNHKLNRNYPKHINKKAQQTAVYNSKKINPDESQLKKNHRSVNSSKSKKLGMKSNVRTIQEDAIQYDRNQKSTKRSSNKKNGRRLINYVTLVLALSLFMVN